MRRWVLLLPLLALPSLGPAACPSGGPGGTYVVEQYLRAPGYVEPHTPGSGAPEEMDATPTVQAIVGTDPDLNRVSYVRTYLARANAPPPRAILILIPGFLGGAVTNRTFSAREADAAKAPAAPKSVTAQEYRLVDATVTLVRRVARGERFYEAELYRLRGELTLAQSSVQRLESSV
jgi:hypothetical protein